MSCFPFVRTQPSLSLNTCRLRDLLLGMVAWQFVLMAIVAAMLLLASPAAASDGTSQPLKINPVVVLSGVLLSTLAGLTSLMMQIRRDLTEPDDKPRPSRKVMISTHMLVAWAAGITAYLLSKIFDFAPPATLFWVFALSFAGERGIWFGFNKVIPGLQPKPSPD